MRYLYIFILLALPLLYSCNEDSNSNNDDVKIRCFTPQDVAESDCPAEELTNMCTTYSCGFNIGDIVGDGPFPPCPGDINSCSFVDCTTLICGDFQYVDINASGNGLSFSFDSMDTMGQPVEATATCTTVGLFNFTCGEDGTIFN